MNRHFRPIFLTLLLAALLAGCNLPGSSASPTPDQAATLNAIIITQYAELTATAQAMPTATPAATATPQPTATELPQPTATPTVQKATGLNFDGVEIFIAFLEGSRSQVTLVSKTLVDDEGLKRMKNDFRMEADKKAYECFLYKMKAVPRLICAGPRLAQNKWIKISVFQKDVEAPVFEKELAVPAQ